MFPTLLSIEIQQIRILNSRRNSHVLWLPVLLAVVVGVGFPGELQRRGVSSALLFRFWSSAWWGRSQTETLQEFPHPTSAGHSLGLLQDLDLRQGDTPSGILTRVGTLIGPDPSKYCALIG